MTPAQQEIACESDDVIDDSTLHFSTWEEYQEWKMNYGSG